MGLKAAYQGFATQLATAAKAVLLYPPEHPARTQPLQRLTHILTEVHRRAEVIAISIEEELLVVNGEPFFDPFPGSAEMFDRMRERGLTRIEVQRGVSGRELQTLIFMLSMAPENLENWENARGFLESQGVEHVQVELEEEDLEYRALQIYTAARDYIVDLWRETRVGNIPRGDKARATMNEMSLLLARDPNLLVGLTMLSDYDNYTFNHSVNVGVFALALSRDLGLGADAEKVGLGGLLHDIGKTRVPLEIINKPGRLTDDEWVQMRRHPEISGEIVKAMDLPDIFETVCQHHCGYNRQGYPELPPLRDLSEGGLITAICDVYDSVTTLRPYQRQHTPQEGIQVLLRLKSAGHLHPKFTDEFIRMLGIFPVGTTVRLNTGEIGLVSANNREHEDLPKIRIVRDARGNMLRIPLDIDLAAGAAGAPDSKARRIIGTLDPAVLSIRPSDYLDPQKMQKPA